MNNQEISRILDIINKTCNFNKLKEDIEYNTLLSKYNKREQKVINLVEERGLSGFRYQKMINQCVEYINKAINNRDSDFKGTGTLKLNGTDYKVNLGKYYLNIPSELFDWVDIFQYIHIQVILINIIGDFKEDDEVKFYPRGKGGYQLNDNWDYNDNNKKLYNVNIRVECYALNNKLNVQSFTSVFYHEFNHAYENYNRLKNSHGGSSFKDLARRKRYGSAISYMRSNNEFTSSIGEILYRLWDNSELTSTAAAIYGELSAINSKRKNYIQDMEKTHTYERYLALKKDLVNVNKVTDEDAWFNVASMMGYYKSNMDINLFRKNFIKRSYMLLDKFFRQIGKVASLYYDKKEGIELNSNKKEYMY